MKYLHLNWVNAIDTDTIFYSLEVTGSKKLQSDRIQFPFVKQITCDLQPPVIYLPRLLIVDNRNIILPSVLCTLTKQDNRTIS